MIVNIQQKYDELSPAQKDNLLGMAYVRSNIL